MERLVLSPLPVKLEKAALMAANHIPEDSDLKEEFADLVDAANRVLCCKAILLEAEKTVPFPLPEGVTPRFYYAMTVGTEIEEDEDCDYPYLGDIVRQAALDIAMEDTQALLRDKYGMKNIVFHNPGSTEGWDKLLSIDIAALTGASEIGITVDERGIMAPWYSTVGLFAEG